jgi:hypothetical protein
LQSPIRIPEVEPPGPEQEESRGAQGNPIADSAGIINKRLRHVCGGRFFAFAPATPSLLIALCSSSVEIVIRAYFLFGDDLIGVCLVIFVCF